MTGPDPRRRAGRGAAILVLAAALALPGCVRSYDPGEPRGQMTADSENIGGIAAATVGLILFAAAAAM